MKRLETECIRIAEYEKDLKLDDMCLFEAINIINALDVVLHKGIFKKKMDKIPDKEISELYEDLLESRKEFREVLSELNEFNARNQKPYAVKKTPETMKLKRKENQYVCSTYRLDLPLTVRVSRSPQKCFSEYP